MVADGRIPDARAQAWLESNNRWGLYPENEVLLQGNVPSDAVTSMSRLSRNMIKCAKVAGATGVAKAAWDIGESVGDSVNQGSIDPLLSQIGKTAAGFAGAWAGAKAGALVAGSLFGWTGPGAIAAAIAGGLIGGALGYFAGEQLF